MISPTVQSLAAPVIRGYLKGAKLMCRIHGVVESTDSEV